jgi:hypothetical protein
MSQSDDPPESMPPSDFDFVLDETRVVILQQILASETGHLSITELHYRNPEETEADLEEEIEELKERDILDEVTVSERDSVDDRPTTFFTVSGHGKELLSDAGLCDELGIWSALYGRMERTEEIEQIEAYKKDVVPPRNTGSPNSGSRDPNGQDSIEARLSEARDPTMYGGPDAERRLRPDDARSRSDSPEE